jgi:hypothetical protein
MFIERLRFATYICCGVSPGIDLPLLLSFGILTRNNIHSKYLRRELDDSHLFPCRLEIERNKDHIFGG